MELGNYAEAKKNLSKFYNTEDFDYLIRMAKWNDHIGDLPTAIKLMEKATSKAELNENGNKVEQSHDSAQLPPPSKAHPSSKVTKKRSKLCLLL